MPSGLDLYCRNFFEIPFDFTLCQSALTRIFAPYRTTYQDPVGTTRTWEHAYRTTKPKGTDVDAVGVVAILMKPGGMGPLLVLLCEGNC
jgi:hypothetical protein